MNNTFSRQQFNQAEPGSRDPLHATTGLLWGTVLGSAVWLMVLIAVFAR